MTLDDCYRKFDEICSTIKFDVQFGDLIDQLILRGNFIFDAHCHFFDVKCVDANYFLKRLLKDLVGVKGVGGQNIHHLVDYLDKNNLGIDQIENFLEENEVAIYKESQNKGIRAIIRSLEIKDQESMRDIYKLYVEKYSLNNTNRFNGLDVISTALMMDLEWSWDRAPIKSISSRIDELIELRASGASILPFFCCDPRRVMAKNENENLYHLLARAFELNNSFHGIKLYPALGYLPSDYRLWPIYKVCEQYGIPIVTHCGGEIISTDQTDLHVFDFDREICIKGVNRFQVAYQLNNPKWWRKVLLDFPNLKLNFAHFGGDNTWEYTLKSKMVNDDQFRKDTIIEFMRKYKNVYADVSYTFASEKIHNNLFTYIKLIPFLQDRILFGTDFWVVNKEKDLIKAQELFFNKVVSNLGYHVLDKFTKINPISFLSSNSA